MRSIDLFYLFIHSFNRIVWNTTGKAQNTVFSISQNKYIGDISSSQIKFLFSQTPCTSSLLIGSSSHYERGFQNYEVETSVASYIIDWIKNESNLNHRKLLYCFSNYSLRGSIHFCMTSYQLTKHFFYFDWGISKTIILNAVTAF